jgi:hypothetical protein
MYRPIYFFRGGDTRGGTDTSVPTLFVGHIGALAAFSLDSGCGGEYYSFVIFVKPCSRVNRRGN